jgi:hypothetical protein
MKNSIFSLNLIFDFTSNKFIRCINRKLSTFFLAFLIFTCLVSCTDTEQNNFDTETNFLVSNSEEYETKLKELTLFFGEVMKDRSALEELYSLADAGKTRDDINYNLKDLFETGISPLSKRKSAIVSAFKSKAAYLRTNGEAVSGDQLIEFIVDNDISVLAPYLVADFNINEIEELTVSWWTKEYEAENIALDENWKGSTKAVLISLNNSSGTKQVLENGSESDYFLANDEWAIQNPTIVLGSFENSDLELLNEKNIGENLNPHARTAAGPVTLCNAVGKSTQNITVRMPAFRLDENIRAWPNPNKIYFWVAFGNFTVGTNGLPTVSPNVNAPFADFEVTRREANIKRWKVTPASFIISSWTPDSDNMYIVWGCTKTDVKIDVSGTLKASSAEDTSFGAELGVKVAFQNSVELESGLSFDKCFTINNNVNSLNQGSGFYGNTNYPVYAFNRIRAYFTLESI